jgi:hypothetical protein
MPNPEALGPASISMGTATSAFMGLMPSFSEVRRADPNDEGMAKDIRLGQIAASAIAIGTGIILSSLSGSPIPAFVSVLMTALLVWCYQNARKAA